MSEQQRRLHTLKSRLESAKDTLSYRVRVTNENVEKRDLLLEKQDQNSSTINYLNDIEKFVKNNYNRISVYLDKKKKDSLAALNAAIYAATTIVSPSTKVKLEIKDKKAKFITDNEQSLTAREGLGFRGVLGFFTRAAIIKNTNYIPFVIFDEAVANLSPANTAILSSKLPIIAKDCQFVIIEQKPEIFRDITECKVYHTQIQEDGYSKVTCIKDTISKGEYE